MITFKQLKKELLKDPWVRFWYIVYWPWYFIESLKIRYRIYKNK